MIFSVINFEISNTDIMVLLASYGVASLKIIPSSLRLINYFNSISNSIPSIKEINKQLLFKNLESKINIEIYDKKKFC